MGISKNKIFVLFLVNFFCCAFGYLEIDGWLNIELSHALNPMQPNEFTFRGNVSISSLNSGMSNSIQEQLTKEQINYFETLAHNNQLYRLKANVVFPNGNSRTYLTSSSACGLLLSQMNDVLWLSIDGAGFVTSISSTPALPNTSGYNCASEHLANNEFNTDVIIKHTELAPVPDTASFIQKVEREREARERGDTRDNRTFFAKYWMYIVPVVLLVLISGVTNQEQPK